MLLGLELCIHHFDNNHSGTASFLGNLGIYYKILGEYQLALDYYKMSEMVFRNLYGENHPMIAACYNNTGIIYKLVQEDNLCAADPDVLNQRASFELNFSLINLIENLNSADILTENIDINQFNFCNSIATRLYENPFLDTANKFRSVDQSAKTGPYPCYPDILGRINIILNDSKEPIVLTIKQEL